LKTCLLKPQRVFATGHSQSSVRLATYVNSVHPLDPVFDAVILHGGGSKIRTDLKIKVWKLNSETDVIIGQGAARQPDTDNFRTWDVAEIHTSIRSSSPAAPNSSRATGIPSHRASHRDSGLAGIRLLRRRSWRRAEIRATCPLTAMCPSIKSWQLRWTIWWRG
jgi:hypothetical protein